MKSAVGKPESAIFTGNAIGSFLWSPYFIGNFIRSFLGSQYFIGNFIWSGKFPISYEISYEIHTSYELSYDFFYEIVILPTKFHRELHRKIALPGFRTAELKFGVIRKEGWTWQCAAFSVMQLLLWLQLQVLLYSRLTVLKEITAFLLCDTSAVNRYLFLNFNCNSLCYIKKNTRMPHWDHLGLLEIN